MSPKLVDAAGFGSGAPKIKFAYSPTAVRGLGREGFPLDGPQPWFFKILAARPGLHTRPSSANSSAMLRAP